MIPLLWAGNFREQHLAQDPRLEYANGAYDHHFATCVTALCAIGSESLKGKETQSLKDDCHNAFNALTLHRARRAKSALNLMRQCPRRY